MGKCYFNDLWMGNSKYSAWIKKVDKNKHIARCNVCLKDIDISNMGEAALTSHMKGKKHRSALEHRNDSQFKIDQLFTTTNSAKTEQIVTPVSMPILDKTSVTTAETLWALKVIRYHFSYHSCANNNKLFQLMFPDSEIAKKFSCGEKKCSYICSHGLAPYFKSMLVYDINSNKKDFVVLFDETLNKFTQTKQMDVYVRFWENEKVSTRYFSSIFMGHATADIMLTNFRDCISCFSLSSIVQLSMDGPNVNWKFFDLLQTTISADSNNKLLNIGSCGLHVINNAFKKGSYKSEWELEKLLSSLYRLFKDSPARRDDFINIVSTDKMPLKFCLHRWLDNSPACERAIHIWPYIEKFVEDINKKVIKDPQTASFDHIKVCVKDKFILAKLYFFSSVSKQLLPFLTNYQNDKPMLPFMATDLQKTLTDLMNRFLKQSVILEASSPVKLLKIDCNDDKNCCHYNNIDVGFQAEKVLKDLVRNGVSDFQVMNFRIGCKNFLQTLVTAFIENNPLQYTLVRCMRCFDPRRMVKNSIRSTKDLKSILSILVDHYKIQAEVCDSVVWQYKEFINSVSKVNEDFLNFKPEKSRIDKLLKKYMSDNASFKELWKVTKLLMLFSHGQATVERGFSVNKELIVENLREDSIKAQRIIYDHIENVGGIENVDISKPLLQSVATSRKKYILHLEEKTKENQKKLVYEKRKAVFDEIRNMQKKKKLIDIEVKALLESADDLALEAEVTNNITYVVKSNSFRKTVHDKEEELKKIEIDLVVKRNELSKL